MATLDDHQLTAVLNILAEVGAFDILGQQDIVDTVDAADTVPELSEPAVPSAPAAAAPPPAEHTPPQAPPPPAPPAPRMADEDPFSERVGAHYDPDHSVFGAGARPPRGLSGGDSARWTLGAKTRQLSDLVRNSDW